jgi:AraC-like DNA-binding protein
MVEFFADRRLNRMREFVTKDMSRRVTLTAAARAAGLESTYFCRYFRFTVGVTFLEWDRQLRVARAKAMLANSGSRISAIALAVGYSDLTTFERNFRRCEGASPREYRARQRTKLETQQSPKTNQEMPRTSRTEALD